MNCKRQSKFFRTVVLTVFALLLLICREASSMITVPSLVGDNMVLQRNKVLHIWGWATPKEKVTLSFNHKTYSVQTNLDGKWNIDLPPQKPGGPYVMNLAGTNKIVIKNIMIGDVWLCSGQSNMYLNTAEVTNAETEVKNADNANIRLFYVPTAIATSPNTDVKGTWKACTPESVSSFSAVAYFFAKNLQPDIKVPVGLIEASFGGTPIEAWISTEGISGDPQFGAQAKDLLGKDMNAVNKKLEYEFNKWIDTIQRKDPGYTNGTYDWSKSAHPEWKVMSLPGYFESRDPALTGKDGIYWLSQTIELKDDDITGNCTLNLGSIINEDMTFINGVNIGLTRNAKYKPRNYPVPLSVLHTGTNFITIRVVDYGEPSGINGKPEMFSFKTAARNIALATDWHFRHSLDTVFKTLHIPALNQEYFPALLYNSMISPVATMAFKGILWYQGESNVDRAYQYRTLLLRLIRDWRAQFKQPDVPFLIVQLPNHKLPAKYPGNSYWAELREAQYLALKLPNTGIIPTIDLGEANNIHPKNKQDVGLRLSRLARSMVYGEPLLATGPSFDKIAVKKNYALVYFKDTGKGLKTNTDSMVNGFQITTDTGKSFIYAKAFIVNKNVVRVNAPDGKQIYALRYAWADNPQPLNLVNSDNLPAFPFRTDQFKCLSFDRRYLNSEFVH